MRHLTNLIGHRSQMLLHLSVGGFKGRNNSDWDKKGGDSELIYSNLMR